MNSPFEHVQIEIVLSLFPSYVHNIKGGVEETLNRLVMKYDEQISGVLLCYSNLEISTPVASILNETPFIHLKVTCKALVFRPMKGQLLTGRVNKVGSHHIGLLVCGVFNASIDASKIPSTYRYQSESESWVCQKIEFNMDVGKEVTFLVDELHESGGLISISGNMLPSETGPSDQPSEPLAHTSMLSDMKDVMLDADSKPRDDDDRKRKRESSDDEEGNNILEKGTSMKKKKKKKSMDA